MSAAEPADPARPYVNTAGAGSVIDITKHRPRGGALAAARGRWTTMTTPSQPPSGQDRQTALARLAESIETTFNGMLPPRTLSDDATADVYLATLDIVVRTLQGSRAQGIISEEQLGELSEMVGGLRQAPRLV